MSDEIEKGKGSVFTSAIHKEQSFIALLESDSEAIKIWMGNNYLLYQNWLLHC